MSKTEIIFFAKKFTILAKLFRPWYESFANLATLFRPWLRIK